MLARVDFEFLAGIVGAALSFGGAIASLIALLLSSAPSPWSFWTSIAFLCAGILSVVWAAHDFREYRLGASSEFARARPIQKIVKFGHEIPFHSLRSSTEEERFLIEHDPDIASDCYSRWSHFDDHLMQLEQLPYTNVGDLRLSFFSKDNEIKRQQIQYLIPRLRQNKILPTTNDNKCGLAMRLGPPIEDVRVYKVGFFDSLITNEAFRSEIRLVPKTNPQDRGRPASINLTSSFPVGRYADGGTYLQPLDRVNAGNHLGITCVLVTKDRRALLFRQGETNVGAGTITAISGSLDWKDLECSEELLGAVKRGFVRELCEEASAETAYEKHFHISSREGRIAHAIQHVCITGFFRWVDRCGKPEFVGAGYTPFNYSELPPDEFEVTLLRLDAISSLELREMSDFNTLLDQLRDVAKGSSDARMKVGLSSYLAMKRLCEIAAYRGSSDAAKEALYDRVKNLLHLT